MTRTSKLRAELEKLRDKWRVYHKEMDCDHIKRCADELNDLLSAVPAAPEVVFPDIDWDKGNLPGGTR